MRKAQVRILSVLLVVALVTGATGFVISGPTFLKKAIEMPVHPQVPAGDAFARSFAGGLAHMKEGRVEEATIAINLATRLRPEVPEAHVNLGFAYLAGSQPALARASFEKALALNEGQINAYYGLAEALELQDDLDGAIGAMKTYVHLSNEDDPFVRKAMAAVWEWEARRSGQLIDTSDPASDIGQMLASTTELGPLDDVQLLLERNRGRVVVLNVWATWCAPCRMELASLDNLNQNLNDNEAVVVGVTIDEDADFAREFLNDVGVGFQNFSDPDGMVLGKSLDLASYPTTFVFDAKGLLMFTVRTAEDWMADDVRGRIEAVIGVKGRIGKRHE